ncbi:DUF3169 family protein [Anaerorhabdus sp.]|uniref:DUF3169 family protein n=1 Tax=Anaerorhabdus sp. TaxID=1872524 RepID=UPI002FC70875
MTKNGKKALKYTLFLILMAFVGGLVGGFSRYFDDDIRQILLNRDLNILILVGIMSAMSAIIVVLFIRATILHIQGKKLCNLVNDEDEELYIKADDKLTDSTTLYSVVQILGIGIALCDISLLNYSTRGYLAFISITLFTYIAMLIISMPIITKNVEYLKKLYPEKRGYFLDFKFEKDWLNSCDEGEKSIIGEAAYLTYSLMTKVFAVLVVFSMVISFLVDNGYMFTLPIVFGWLTMIISYQRYARKIERKRRG